MLQERVCGEDTVVWLNNRGGDLRRRVDSETKFGFLAIINRETLQQKRTETRTSSSTNSIENQEPLETSAVVSKLSDAVQTQINDLFPN